MKLATLKTQHRDGELIVVSRDLNTAISANVIAPTMQAALDQWHLVEPKLQALYELLNAGKCEHTFPFDEYCLAAPLPRAYQWADGSAYVNHVELVRKARGAEMPENFWTDPLIYQGGSDNLLGPRASIDVTDEAHGIDFEAEIAVITDDVPMGVSIDEAAQHIKLITLVNDVSLRNLIPNELAKGFGFFQSKPASSFSPVVVTPDELGNAWDGHKCHLPLVTHYNGEWFGAPNAGEDMTFDFPTLIAHTAKTRRLTAGTIIGSGTVSNVDRSKGSSCLAEKRMLEVLEKGEATTPFMRFGDRVRIEMNDSNGDSIFGAIDNQIRQYRNDNAL